MQADLYTNYDQELMAFHQKSLPLDIHVHLHDCYEIFIPLSEGIQYYIEGNAYPLMPGDLVITNQQEIHRPVLENKELYERMVIQFHPQSLIDFFPKGYYPLDIFENRFPGTRNCFKSILNTYPEQMALINALIAQLKNPGPKSLAQGKLILIQFLMFLDEHAAVLESSHKYPPMDDRIKRVLLYINEHYTESLSLDEISSQHYMDKFYLSHLFKAYTGFTVMEYIQSKRIQRAKALIGNGLSIIHTSLESGFEDYSNFYRTFRKYVHMSPKAYQTLVIK